MHSWRNLSEDGTWARMLFVLLPAEKVKIGEKELEAYTPDVREVGS
jgi:hypothetical protein